MKHSMQEDFAEGSTKLSIFSSYFGLISLFVTVGRVLDKIFIQIFLVLAHILYTQVHCNFQLEKELKNDPFFYERLFC